jgi:hypothetical protein
MGWGMPHPMRSPQSTPEITPRARTLTGIDRRQLLCPGKGRQRTVIPPARAACQHGSASTAFRSNPRAVSPHAGDDPRSKLRPPVRPHSLFSIKGRPPPSRQGPGRLRACRAPLGGRGVSPAFLRCAACRPGDPLPATSLMPVQPRLRQRAEADGRHRLRLHRRRKPAHDPQDHPPEHCPRVDIYEEVTAQIIAMLEAGTRPWSPRWASGAATLPLRHEGTAYRGINILLLWTAAMTRGYANPYWMTYRQAAELGGQVEGRKGQSCRSCRNLHPQGWRNRRACHQQRG